MANFLKIREARKNAGLTQDQLAKTLGINRATLSRYESGEIDPPISQIQKISQALNVSINDLLGLKPLWEKTFVDDDGHVEQADVLTEWVAFREYLKTLGYHAYGGTKSMSPNTPLFLYDKREDEIYFLEKEVFEALETHVNAFVKFQMCEIVRDLKKVQIPGMKERLKEELFSKESVDCVSDLIDNPPQPPKRE